MKYESEVYKKAIAVRKDDAAAMVGGETVLQELIDKKLLAPVIRRHRLTVFDVDELTAAWKILRTAIRVKALD